MSKELDSSRLLLQRITDPTKLVSTVSLIFKNIFKYQKDAVRSFHRENRLKVVRGITSGDTFSRLIELYGTENCPEFVKADIIYIVWKIAEISDESPISDALRKGVPILLKGLEKVSDDNMVTRLMFVIDNIAHDKEWNTTRKHLVETGFLDQMTVLLDKWQGNKSVVLTLFWTLSNLTLRTTHFKCSEVTLPDGRVTNLPAILQKILIETTPTEENGSLFQRNLRIIEGLLFGNTLFHEHFTNKAFIDSLFVLIRSKNIIEKQKYRILFQIITALTCNNPREMRKLLVPHSKQLEDLANFHTNVDISRAAATIVKKYLCCDKDKHLCRVISSSGKFTLAFFILVYGADLFGDLIVGYNTITDSETSLHKEGYLLLVFSIAPLVYINVLSYQQFKKGNHQMLYTDQIVSLEGQCQGRFTSYLFHWKWDSVKHVIFNILTILQMHPIIAAVEMLYHKPQEMLSILSKMFNFTRLNIQSKILENVPCIFLKLLVIYKTYKAIRDYNHNLLVAIPISALNKSSMREIRNFPRTDDYMTLITTVISVISLISSLIKFEQLCRTAASSICSDLGRSSQVIALNVGYFAMITARIMMCLVLFHLLESHGPGSGYRFFSLCISVHILLTFLSHLLSYHFEYDPFYGLSKKRTFPVIYFIRCKFYNSKLMNPLHSVIKRVFLVFALSWGEFFVVMLRHPIEFLEGHPHVQHQRSGRHFALIFCLHLTELVVVSSVCFLSHSHDTPTFYIGIGSIALYLVSGAVFLVYFRYLHPDNSNQNTLPSLHTNNRVKLINSSNQDNDFVPLWNQFCDVTNDNGAKFTMDGETVYRAEQFNYRLQDIKACIVCCQGLSHHVTMVEPMNETDEERESREEELNHLMMRVRKSKALYSELPNLDQAVTLNSENPRFLELYRQNLELRSQIERKYEVLQSTMRQDTRGISEVGLLDFRDTCQTFFYWSAIQWESAVKENSRRKPGKNHHIVTVSA